MPFARNTDPSTSHAAAASIRDLTEVQNAIYLMLLTRPMYDQEGYRFYQMGAHQGICPEVSESGYRSRRSELVAKGLVEDTGERHALPSGRLSIVWRAIPRKVPQYLLPLLEEN